MAFASAVILLFLSGLATYLTIVRLLESQKWVVHSHEVQAALGNVDSTTLDAGRARSGYVVTGDADFLSKFDAAVPRINQALQHLRDLTQDNSTQQNLCTRLEELTARRVDLLQESISLRKSAPLDEAGQTDISRRVLPVAGDITSTMQQMRDEEQRLLDIRARVSNHLFLLAVIVLVITFILALMLFSVHYQLLTTELDAREQAERAVRESEKSLRSLTARLLQLQDEERRRFSRELHDSLGQYLAAVKMNLDMFSNSQPADRLLSEAMHLLEQSIVETRTISHLLHPPLLDEAGFASAARWYVEGFAQRSGIEVTVDFPGDVGRLPRPIELGQQFMRRPGMRLIEHRIQIIGAGRARRTRHDAQARRHGECREQQPDPPHGPWRTAFSPVHKLLTTLTHFKCHPLKLRLALAVPGTHY